MNKKERLYQQVQENLEAQGYQIKTLNNGKTTKFTCPSCRKKNHAYVYSNNPQNLRCSSKNCGWKKHSRDFLGVDYPKTKNSGLTERRKQYLSNHSIDYQYLQKQGVLDSYLNLRITKGYSVKLVDDKDNNGKIIGLKTIAPSKGKKPNWATQKEIGNIHEIVDNDHDTLQIMEGFADYLKAINDGLTCTSVIFGAGTPVNDSITIQNIVDSGKTTIIFNFDSDSVGKENAPKRVQELAAQLPEYKIGYRALEFGNQEEQQGHKDYCDYRKHHTVEQFLSLPVKYIIPKLHENVDLDKPETPQDIEIPQGIHPFFEQYWKPIEGTTEAPKEYVITALLNSMGATLGNKTYLHTGPSKIRPNLYTVIVGDSTFMRKTTSMDYGTKALRELSKEKKQEYIKALEQWETEIETAKSNGDTDKQNELKNKKPKDKSHIYPSEFSPEMLLEKMSGKPDGVFIYSELGSLLSSLDKGYMQGFKEKLTEFFDGRDVEYTRETKSSGAITIESPAPSLLACSTLQWMQAHLNSDDMLSGFLARFLFVSKKQYPNIDVAFPPPFEISDQHKNLFQELDKFNYSLKLDKEAQEVFTDWYKRFKKWSLKQDVQLHSFLGRLMTACHKIAIINHAIEYILRGSNHNEKLPEIITKESYLQAFPWIKFFAQNIMNCYQELTTKQDIREMKIMEVIKRKGQKMETGKKNKRVIMLAQSKVYKHTNMSKKQTLDVLETMEAKKYIAKFPKGKRVFWGILE